MNERTIMKPVIGEPTSYDRPPDDLSRPFLLTPNPLIKAVAIQRKLKKEKRDEACYL